MTWALNVCWSSGRFDSFAAVMPSGTVSAGSDCPGSRTRAKLSSLRSFCILPAPASSCTLDTLVGLSSYMTY